MSYSMTKSIRHRNKVMTFDVPKVMGVLNMTPDSFSDGGVLTIWMLLWFTPSR